MKTKSKKITNLIIIDASGSMSSKAEEIRGGLKQLFETIRKERKLKQRTVVVDFSNSFDIRLLVDTVKEPEDKFADDYKVRGMTALYDAMGYGFSLVEKDENVFVSILTDGDENDSKEYKYEDIKNIIEKKRKENNWVITFMGTTEDSLKKAQGMGISIGNTMSFMNNSSGVNKSMRMSNKAYSSYLCSFSEQNNSKIDLDSLIKDAEKQDDNN